MDLFEPLEARILLCRRCRASARGGGRRGGCRVCARERVERVAPRSLPESERRRLALVDAPRAAALPRWRQRAVDAQRARDDHEERGVGALSGGG